MVSREEAISNSYAAMALMTAVVKSAIAPAQRLDDAFGFAKSAACGHCVTIADFDMKTRVSMRSSELKKRHTDRFGERLKKKRATLSPGLLAVADYIDKHRHAVLAKSALEIGRELGTSDATVIRAIQALGFEGLIDLKDTLESHLGETDSPSKKWRRLRMSFWTTQIQQSILS